MRRHHRLILILAAALPVASAASAHGIWFAERGRQVALIYGIGADDLDMVKRLPLVVTVGGYDAAYRPVPATLRAAGPVAVVEAAPAPVLLTAVLDNGIWSREGDAEFEKGGRDEHPDATLAERTVKYTVAVRGALSAPVPALPGQRLQIVPGAIPATLGTPLTYTILYDGRPVAGARVIADMVTDPDAKEVATAADGTVTLPVRNQGLNVVRAVYDGPSDAPTRYDRIEHTATLAFALPHAPE